MIAKVIVKNGTLHVGDVIVCGAAYGRVKAMYDTLRPRVRVKAAGPSTPVNITGLRHRARSRRPVLRAATTSPRPAKSPASDTRDSRAAVAGRHAPSRSRSRNSSDAWRKAGWARPTKSSTLNLIIRADVRGSIEAIQKELGKLEHPEVQIKILQASVGGITVADVTLAHASHAVIIGFNVIPDEAARALADERHVEIRRYDVIYKVTDDIKAMLEGKLKPEERVVELGQALVKQVFAISRVGAIAGCYVVRGTDRARLPHSRQSRRPHHRRLRPGFAATRKGRRQGSAPRHGMRHQAVRLQRHETRTTCWKPTRSRKWPNACRQASFAATGPQSRA